MMRTVEGWHPDLPAGRAAPSADAPPRGNPPTTIQEPHGTLQRRRISLARLLWVLLTWPMRAHPAVLLLVVTMVVVPRWPDGSGRLRTLREGRLPPLDFVPPDNSSLAFAAEALESLCVPLATRFASPHIATYLGAAATTLAAGLEDGRRLAEQLPCLARDAVQTTDRVEQEVLRARAQVDLHTTPQLWFAFAEAEQGGPIVYGHDAEDDTAVVAQPRVVAAARVVLKARNELERATMTFSGAAADARRLLHSLSVARAGVLRPARSLTLPTPEHGWRRRLTSAACWTAVWGSQYVPFSGVLLGLTGERGGRWVEAGCDVARSRAVAGMLGIMQWATEEIQLAAADVEMVLQQVDLPGDLEEMTIPGHNVRDVASLLLREAATFRRHAREVGAEALRVRFGVRRNLPGQVDSYLRMGLLRCRQHVIRAADSLTRTWNWLLDYCAHCWWRTKQLLALFGIWRLLVAVGQGVGGWQLWPVVSEVVLNRLGRLFMSLVAS
jgi:hypothetical protein